MGRTFAVLGGFLEKGGDRPSERGEPLLCPKVVPTTSGEGGEIACWPSLSSVSIEAEMALVVGRTVRSARPEEAAAAIWGYTCFNDVTATEHFPQFWLAKGFETFASMGPWVCTDLTDEQIRDGLDITARVNGATVQSGTTARYRFWPWEVVAYLSGLFTLDPGRRGHARHPAPAGRRRARGHGGDGGRGDRRAHQPRGGRLSGPAQNRGDQREVRSSRLSHWSRRARAPCM